MVDDQDKVYQYSEHKHYPIVSQFLCWSVCSYVQKVYCGKIADWI